MRKKTRKKMTKMKIKWRKERQRRRLRKRRERSVLVQVTAAEMAIPHHLLVPHQKQSVLDASDQSILCFRYM